MGGEYIVSNACPLSSQHMFTMEGDWVRLWLGVRPVVSIDEVVTISQLKVSKNGKEPNWNNIINLDADSGKIEGDTGKIKE